VVAESLEREQDAGQHSQREEEARHLSGGTVAESHAIVIDQPGRMEELHSQTTDVGSPCPSLSTHGEVGTDSGEPVTGSDYANFSPDVAHELSSLVRLLVSFWFYRLWPSVRDSSATPLRSCTQGAEDANTSNDTHQSRGGPSAPRSVRGRVAKRGRKSTDADDSGDHGRKRGRPNRNYSGGDVILLACPFSKFDPLRYSDVNFIEREYRGCSTPCLTDISRLKYEALLLIMTPLCLDC
jgi:hypothetical protein